jgi:ABC-type dipeptide/oligopeptide/nickel transport system permease subunit
MSQQELPSGYLPDANEASPALAMVEGWGASWAATLSAKPRFSRRLTDVAGLAGLLLLGGMLLLALFPQMFAPFDPTELAGRPFLPPGDPHPLGTNDIGQDLLSELIWGTRASLLTGLVVAVVAVAIGTAAGLITGYYHNSLSAGLLILVDLVLVLPFLPLVILLGAYLGPSQSNVILVLILVSWAIPARLIRSRVLTVAEAPFVEAARALGSSDWRIVVFHIWPATRTLTLVQLVLVAGTSILAEASLSFLGLGDPSAKSWGTMLYFARASGVFLGEAWKWWVVPAGVMITLSVLALVLIAYTLERRLEPNIR